MVQSLESKSVRSSIGCHWKDWTCQSNTRLAAARDRSSERGLTRVEATFYLPHGNIPCDKFIEKTPPNNRIYSQRVGLQYFLL